MSDLTNEKENVSEITTVKESVSGRVASIDALRGFDMIWIVGGAALIHALHQAIPGPTTALLSHEFEHVPWQGFHFYDLIFPLFIFVMGLVLPFSLSRYQREGADRKNLYKRVIRRTLLLFFLGLIYNGLLNFNWHDLRIPGVLQRIALCYFFAALIMTKTRLKGQITITGLILVGYFAVMKLVPVPGIGAGVITPAGNLAGYIDRHFLPRPFCCYPYGDNEGILSTIPAVSTAMIGALTGQWLKSQYTPVRKVSGLFLGGVIALAAGLVWGHWFPIIKNVWTSSYVLYAAGWSLLLLGLFYLIMDVWGYRRWAFFFQVVGMNAITIYVLHNLFNFRLIASIFVHGFIYHFGAWTPFAWDLSAVAVEWVLLWHLYRQKIFLRV